MPVAAAANEAFKAAMALGLGDSDFAAVYEATQAGKKAPTTQ
jgi:glyoxylate/succinic semialdehyde reductase